MQGFVFKLPSNEFALSFNYFVMRTFALEGENGDDLGDTIMPSWWGVMARQTQLVKWRL